ncbi:MAG TPA: ATP-binding protein [Polyangiaceae bacterium]|nr:ATP-binding protein [Polyangiaceae bacterium]
MSHKSRVSPSSPTHEAQSARSEESEAQRLRRLTERLVDERRAAELTRDEYVDLFDLAPLPGLTLDAAYITRRMNQAMCALLGVVKERCIDQSFRGFVLPDDRRLLSEHLARTPYAPTARCRLHLLPSSSEPIPVELWSNVMGRSGLYQLCVVDLRQEVLSAFEAGRLVEAERSARSESAAKDVFIAMLSHELRTPLTPALAVASFFRESHASRDARRAFSIIERNLHAEVRMIDDLLDLNRVVRGKMAVTCRALSVHDVLCEAAEELRPLANAKHQTLALDLRAENQYASVDGLRLRQVFGNLIRNAVKFTDQAGNICVRSWNQGSRLVVEVEDDGIGIAPEELHRLFTPFDQLAVRPGAVGGLGLGLAISRGLLELQGGRLSVQSAGLGRGSRFVVELETVPEPEATGPSRAEAQGVSPVLARVRRILLVEDDPDSAEVLAELLVASGFEVQTAASVRAARAVDMTMVDLIVSDIGLPDGSGLDLIRELQADRHRPAVALTGFGRESDVVAAVEAGFDAHLTKPIDIHRLLEMLIKMSQAL